jgi:hypothetical protein
MTPKHCSKCGKLAKIGTPGTVRVPFNGNIIELQVESPMCSSCIGELLRPFGKVAGKTIANEGHTASPTRAMGKLMGAGTRPRKWIGKRH